MCSHFVMILVTLFDAAAWTQGLVHTGQISSSLSRATCAEVLLLAIVRLYIHSVGSMRVISIEVLHRSSWL